MYAFGAVLSDKAPFNQTEAMLNQSISNMDCGVNFCSSINTALEIDEGNMIKAIKPPMETIYLLFRILFGFSLMAATILIFFLDNTKE